MQLALQAALYQCLLQVCSPEKLPNAPHNWKGLPVDCVIPGGYNIDEQGSTVTAKPWVCPVQYHTSVPRLGSMDLSSPSCSKEQDSCP